MMIDWGKHPFYRMSESTCPESTKPHQIIEEWDGKIQISNSVAYNAVFLNVVKLVAHLLSKNSLAAHLGVKKGLKWYCLKKLYMAL
jgi:hypothetical protein